MKEVRDWGRAQLIAHGLICLMDDKFDLEKEHKNLTFTVEFVDIIVPWPHEFSLDKFPTTEAGVVASYERLAELAATMARDYQPFAIGPP
jgi:hypothetical protein